MKIRKGIFYLVVSVANIVLGYFSRMYMMTAFVSLIYYIDSKQGIPQWWYHLDGILMFLLWFMIFSLMNFMFCLLADKKHTVSFYIIQMLLSAAGFLLAFIVA